MAFKYALTGPPFNFLGNFSETQHNALTSWVNTRTGNFPAITTHHQIRAQQLRKTAGLLEKYYSSANGESLPLTFQKEAWKPGSNGQWSYGNRNDHEPAMAVSNLKNQFRFQFQRQEESYFHMYHLRNQIERQEDLATFASTAPTTVSGLMTSINNFFGQKEYEAVLVKDITGTYQGQPMYRVHQADAPTAWEQYQHSYGPSATSGG